MKVSVIGAGVIGLSSAVAIQERLSSCRVTVIADKFDRHTSSYGSGGWICPVARGIPQEIGRQWCKDSADYFFDLAFSSDAKIAGVTFISGFSLTNEDEPPDTLQYVINVHKLEPAVMQRFKQFSNGYSASTCLVDMPVYMDWLMKKFTSRGGIAIRRTIKSLQGLSAEYDVVINCTGMGSRQLVNDPLMRPVRGQLMHLHAPWIKSFIHSPETFVIFPFSESVVTGSVKQVDNWNETISEEDSRNILQRAVDIYPPLKGAKVLWEWAGLRPQRDPLRLEEETIATQGKPLKVIHNYGHGAIGVSLSWGCAVQVSKMVEKLSKQPTSRL